MNRPAVVIAVDIGNTAVKLIASFRDSDRRLRQSFRLSDAKWLESFARWLESNVEKSSADAQLLIASVNGRAKDPLLKMIATRFQGLSLRSISFADVPMPVDVMHPERVGIDRLLSALAAKNNYSAPIVVIDAGSAVTVDLVDHRGHFLGGAILPGLHLQASALSMGTDALPVIHWDGTVESLSPQDFSPGKNTSHAIRLGVLTSVTAAIDQLIGRYQKHLAALSPNGCGNISVVLCGGDASLISPHITHRHELRDHLVCEGILALQIS